MSDVHRQRIVTTRKPHTCDYCLHPIPSETANVRNEHGIYGGEPYSRYACPVCAPLVAGFWEWVNHETYSIPDAFEEYCLWLESEVEG